MPTSSTHNGNNGNNHDRERIAMVSTHGYVAAEPPLGAPDTGGQVVYVIELSKKLALLGYDVDIWTRQFEDQPQIEEVDEHVRIIRMPCGGKDFIPKETLHEKLPSWTEKALRYIKNNGLQYTFINSHYWDAGTASQDMAEALKIPHVHTPHSIGSWKRDQMVQDFTEDAEKLDETYNFKTRIANESYLYKECDLLIATSPIQLDMFFKDYDVDREKVKMIPPGYDDNRFFPVGGATRMTIRERYGYKPEDKIVTSIGRLSRNKGFDLLIDAFSIIAERMEHAKLHLPVGSEDENQAENPMRAELDEKIKEYGLEGRVTISKSLEDDEMPDFYRMGDVFCLPSRYEPFGMTAIEAMACGTPTVITTNGGLFRTINYGNDALFADSFDKEDLGVTLLKPLRYRPIAKRISNNGAHKVRSLFTWTGIAQQLLRAVEQRDSAVVSVDEYA